MVLPGMGPRRDPQAVSRVRAWVREEIADDGVTVLVTELACTEPGCPLPSWLALCEAWG